MNIKTSRNPIKIIKTDDPNFMVRSGLTIGPRAGFEVSLKCPKEYRKIITECIDLGWLKPVAYMTEREMMISGLLKESVDNA